MKIENKQLHLQHICENLSDNGNRILEQLPTENQRVKKVLECTCFPRRGNSSTGDAQSIIRDKRSLLSYVIQRAKAFKVKQTLMKKIFYAFIATLCAMTTANAQIIDASRANDAPKEKKSVLVAYFSVTGNTKKVATELAAAVGADAWEIVPLVPYTEEDLDYKNPKSRSTIEMQDPYERPTIKMCTDIRSYKVIFLGFPIWWGVCPKIINSWIENNDLTGKVLIPFATSGSSQIAPAVDALRKTYPNYTWDDGKLLNSYPDGFLKEWTSKYVK